MQMPITDAFDDTDSFERFETALTPAQIEWLETQADERGVSVNHMLRAVVTAQMRSGEEASGGRTSGDSASWPSSGTRHADGEWESRERPSSFIDNLRSAHDRLQDLTSEGAEAKQPMSQDAVTRLQTHTERSEATAEQSERREQDGSDVPERSDRSMFDLVEDE